MDFFLDKPNFTTGSPVLKQEVISYSNASYFHSQKHIFKTRLEGKVRIQNIKSLGHSKIHSSENKVLEMGKIHITFF